MCPHLNGDSLPNDPSQMVPVDLSNSVHTNGLAPSQTNGVNGHANGLSNGVNGHANGTHGSNTAAQMLERQRRNPYAPRASDFLSNVSNFKIIESTLRGRVTPFKSLCINLIHIFRGRAVCQCILRYQNQDCHRQGTGCLRC